MPKVMRNEKDVKNEIKKVLDHHGWFWWMPMTGGYGKSGISDFGAVKDSMFLVIEAKHGYNKPTPPQLGYLSSIRSAGHFGFIVNDKNIEWLDAYLESLSISALAHSRKQDIPAEHGARMINAIAALMPDVVPDKIS